MRAVKVGMPALIEADLLTQTGLKVRHIASHVLFNRSPDVTQNQTDITDLAARQSPDASKI